MVVVILDNASEKLLGILTRWMIGTKPGVFIGSLNSLVREKLWAIVEENEPKGALIAYTTNNEQGYHIDMLGEPTRSLVDLDGLQLIKRK